MEHAVYDSIKICDKQKIADSFSKAAMTYDQHAAFQRDVGTRLLNLLPANLKGKQVLDLGCGTGYFSQLLRERGAIVTCLDLSPIMLEVAKSRCGEVGVSYQVGDAEQLPFDSDSFDMVFSSLALQWCDDLSVPLKEIKRVVKPQGRAGFATLLDGSLAELKQAWGKIDTYQHVNEFVSFNQVKVALAQSGCHSHHLDLPTMVVWYPTAISLMRDLKGIGANHVSERSPKPLCRNSLKKIEQEYLGYANQQGLLPATYQVCMGVINL
ncbi:malonyl-ACP O-methyltransferase BioC [Vibrio sonorensis]|uniref:malonyl-ACP O-methyltransferase BioC n=1 Tax=Vibrio sonorensis TaxID=1004316 RepID=UPI0008DA4C0A|nr:malonyl-ACP O-methyltransferase BioC [Vibrio sonorensis]